MKIEFEIKGDALAVAEICLKSFKEKLAKDWDLEKAVKESTKIISIKDGLDKEGFLTLVYTRLHWREIIDAFKVIDKDKIVVRMFNVEYKDWVKYKPGAISKDNREIILKEEKEDGQSLILIQSFIEQPLFTIKNFVDNSQFTYPEEKWFRK